MFYLTFSLAFILDIFIGDPSSYPHPVRCIGQLISFYERLTRKITILHSYFAGCITVLLTVFTTAVISVFLFIISSYLSGVLTDLLALFFIYTIISYGDLKKESMAVHSLLLDSDDLVPARNHLSRIVGRDTEHLDRQAIIRATVETVAENSSDGIIAPMFWAVFASIFGYFLGVNELVCAAVGGLLYKTINTMDSMLGYTNDKYIHFGFFAAKLDDVANYIPARLTGVGIVLASFLLQLDYVNSYQTLKKDCRKHTSPNAGFPEAAVAGALGVELGGTSSYFGTVKEKPVIGKEVKKINEQDIVVTNRLNLVTAVLLLGVMFFIKLLIQKC